MADCHTCEVPTNQQGILFRLLIPMIYALRFYAFHSTTLAHTLSGCGRLSKSSKHPRRPNYLPLTRNAPLAAVSSSFRTTKRGGLSPSRFLALRWFVPLQYASLARGDLLRRFRVTLIHGVRLTHAEQTRGGKAQEVKSLRDSGFPTPLCFYIENILMNGFQVLGINFEKFCLDLVKDFIGIRKHGDLLLGIIRRVLIKYSQPVVVDVSRRLVRAVSVFHHTGSPTLCRLFRGSGLLDLLHFILSVWSILEIELNRAGDLAIQRTVVICRALYKSLVHVVVGEAICNLYHDPIIGSCLYSVKPQFSGDLT